MITIIILNKKNINCSWIWTCLLLLCSIVRKVQRSSRLNRKGRDSGTQYQREVIQMIQIILKNYKAPILTHWKPDHIKNYWCLRSDECDSCHLKLFVAVCPFRALLLYSTLYLRVLVCETALFFIRLSHQALPCLFHFIQLSSCSGDVNDVKPNMFCSPSLSPMFTERS